MERDGWGQAVDGVHLRDAHLVKEPAGVGRDGFQITALRFGVKCAERERGFAGAGHAGKDHQSISGDIDIDISEIVLTRAAHVNESGEL